MVKKLRSGWRTLHTVATAIAAGVLVAGMFVTQKVLYLTAPPGDGKDCEPLNPEHRSAGRRVAVAFASMLSWLQKGGTINDASCLDETAVYGIVSVTSEKDIANALAFARQNRLKVSVAGVRHSMGGQAFAPGNLVLDMTAFDGITVDDAARTMRVRSGATWHAIQEKIHPRYAVSAMQSTDIFTVGGSISVNAHGMDHTVGAVENSIVWLRLMLPDGSIKRLSRTENRDLYDLVVGGYGLFGIILDAELRLADNDVYRSSRKIIGYRDFPDYFEREIRGNPDVGLMYTHLSTAPGDGFLDEGIVYVYTKSAERVAPEEIPPLAEVSGVKLRRLVMNLSKYGGLFQTLRWWTEKYLEPRMESCSISRNEAQSSGEACLVARNEPMHDSVPYLKNSLKRETDILHEYFVPRGNLTPFIDGMREIMRKNEVNLLNASIRVVNRERCVLSYAPKEAFSVVLYINQVTDGDGNERMRKVTSELIDLAVRNDGRFFLPYQLHYTREQLRASYPEIDAFFAAKRRIDPEGLLTNTWYEKYGGGFQ